MRNPRSWTVICMCRHQQAELEERDGEEELPSLFSCSSAGALLLLCSSAGALLLVNPSPRAEAWNERSWRQVETFIQPWFISAKNPSVIILARLVLYQFLSQLCHNKSLRACKKMLPTSMEQSLISKTTFHSPIAWLSDRLTKWLRNV